MNEAKFTPKPFYALDQVSEGIYNSSVGAARVAAEMASDNVTPEKMNDLRIKLVKLESKRKNLESAFEFLTKAIQDASNLMQRLIRNMR